jgi:exodeoxyribonuclease V alpha subunit
MTVHKSQGSEFEHSVLVLPNSQSPILTRELIYTALTRARRQVTLCGSASILRHGLARTVTRASSLGTLLWGESVDDPTAPSS